jgi:hypothetical protein
MYRERGRLARRGGVRERGAFAAKKFGFLRRECER